MTTEDAGRWSAWADGELRSISDAGRLRTTSTFDARGPSGTHGGTEVVSYASNDYLGLSCHPRVLEAAHDALERWGAGSTASRLVVGSRPVHRDLEAALTEWKATDAALVTSSGYAANLAVLTSLGGPDCHVVSDELNHASIIDGCRLGRSRVSISRHNDLEHVAALLADTRMPRAMVVTDTVFSMDGDEAPVRELADTCARHGALLVLDDAHAVLGPDTSGLDEIEGLEVLRVVTLSKALGSLGGAICGPRELVALVLNRARSFIFSTALGPADCAAALAALEVVTSDEGAHLVERLRANVDRVAGTDHPSPIVPVLVGTEQDAVAAAAALLERGLLVPAIRPPTVPPGTSRLRIALSAAHTDEMLEALLNGLDAVGLTVGPDTGGTRG
ncbi:MAG: 8-amino-7-oxononanoate synthase [Microthrixaceae bacterium]|nr:8-amino-7-oxononanoate synthase [Microthrixaceae bacterium]